MHRITSVREMYPGKTGTDLLRAMLLDVYTSEGVEIWIADASKKGQSLDDQLVRAEQLVTGAFI